jgi:hypothetical protein
VFVDCEGYRNFVAKKEREFLRKLENQEAVL